MTTLTKIKLETTLHLLKEANPCNSGLATLIESLPKKHTENKAINLLHILKSNGVNHFFWAFRALKNNNSHKVVLRLILAEIVERVIPIYEKQYPKDKRLRGVIKALKTGKGIKVAAEDAEAANAVACAAADAAYAAAYAADAAADAATYAATYAANAAVHAAHAATYAAADAANAVACAANAVACAAAKSADAANAADAADFIPERKEQVKIIKKYLK